MDPKVIAGISSSSRPSVAPVEHQGYLIVRGAPTGLPGVRVSPVPGTGLPASLWLQELDAALRSASRPLRLPAPEFARHLSTSGATPERQALTWLAALARQNGGRVDLLVDGVEGWPGSSAFWPRTLPTGVHVVLAVRGKLPDELAMRLGLLEGAGAVCVGRPEERLPASPDLRTAEPWAVAWFRDTAPERYRECCREMARWAHDTLMGGNAADPAFGGARDGLWTWVEESGNPTLATRMARSEALARVYRGIMDGIPPLHALRIATAWHAVLKPLAEQENPLVEQSALLEVQLRHADLLLRTGAPDEAWAVAHECARATRDPRALTVRSRAALARNMVAAAVEDATRAVEQLEIDAVREGPSAELGRARLALGHALLASGAAPAATSHLEGGLVILRSLDEIAGSADVYLVLAGLALGSGNAAAAETRCNQALELLEGRDLAGEAECLARRARVLLRLGRRAEAVEDLRRAADLHTELLEEGRLDLAASAAQVHYDLGGVPMLTEAIRLAETAVEEARHTSSRALLARALSDRGLLRMRSGDLEGALADCSRAIEIGEELLERERKPQLRSDLARAHNNRAQTLARRGQTELALREFGRAAGHYENLIARQKRSEFRHHLALVLFNMGAVQPDSRQALADYTKALELLSALRVEGAEVVRDLASVYARRGLTSAGRGDLAAALADYDHAVVLHCGRDGAHLDLAGALQGRGRVHQAGGRAAEAQEDFSEALRLLRSVGAPDERLADVLHDRGAGLVEVRQYAAAVADLRESVQRVRCAGPVLDLGRALAGLGQDVDARKCFDEGMELLGRDDHARRADALHCRALVRFRLEGYEAAMGDLEAALLLGGGPHVRNDRARLLLAHRRVDDALAEVEGTLAELAEVKAETRDTVRALAEARALRGHAMHAQGRVRESLAELTRAIAVWSQLAEGAQDLDMWEELAQVYLSRAEAHRSVGDTRNAIFDYGWAVDLFRELVMRHGRLELEEDLATACAARGILLLDADECEKALPDLRLAADLGLTTEAGSGRNLRDALRWCEESR